MQRLCLAYEDKSLIQALMLKYSAFISIHMIIVWVTDRKSSFSENSSQVLTSIGIVPTLESFLRSIARYNIIISQWLHSERIEGTSLDPLYILQLPVNKANLIISDQQANFRGGNIRLEEIGWGGEEGGAAKLPWKLAFRLALSTPTNRVLPVNKQQLGFPTLLACIWGISWDSMHSIPTSYFLCRGTYSNLCHIPHTSVWCVASIWKYF